jgi:hypothetical protein
LEVGAFDKPGAVHFKEAAKHGAQGGVKVKKM